MKTEASVVFKMKILYFLQPHCFFSLFLCLLFLVLNTDLAFGKQNRNSTIPDIQTKKTSNSELTVAHCFDGDTIKLSDRRIVRLAGIDAPEMPHDGTKGQYYAREARQELMRLVQNQKIRIFPIEENEGRDVYGRIVADVQLNNGQSVNALMIRRGAAFVYPHKDIKTDFQKNLLELQKKAIADKLGLWARLLSLPLALNSYIGNRLSLRFFPADCQEVHHIKPRNKIYFGTLMDAFFAGYAPGRTCLFWPPAP